MIKLHKMLDTLKKIFLFLIPDMDSKHRKSATNELMLSPAYVLTKGNTAELSLYSICRNVSSIERQLRFQILKHWPHLHGSGIQILHGKQMQEIDGDDKLFQMFKIVATNEQYMKHKHKIAFCTYTLPAKIYQGPHLAKLRQRQPPATYSYLESFVRASRLLLAAECSRHNTSSRSP